MWTNGTVKIFYTNVEPLTTGSRIFRDKDHIVDIEELHNELNNTNSFVVVCNDVSKYSELTEKQYFIVTDKLAPEDGYDESFVFAHFGRSSSVVTNRKILMSFKKENGENVLKASYFNS